MEIINPTKYFPDKSEFKKLARKGNLIPVYAELPADITTPASAFCSLSRNRGYAFLLESIEGGAHLARYSFLAVASKIILPKGEPLEELKRLLSKFRYVRNSQLPRFSGGLVGYVGYDCVRYYEGIPDKNPDSLGLPEAAFMFVDEVVIFDHLTQKIKLVVNAFCPKSSSKGVDEVYDEALRKIELLKKRLISKSSNKAVKRSGTNHGLRSNFTKRGFIDAVRKAKRYIHRGDVVQVVISQRLERKISCTPFEIYRSLRSINPSPYMYYLKMQDFQLIGSSPEVHVRCEDGRVEIRPIAGTRPRGRTKVEDERLEDELLKDEKERAEHIMLVDLGRNDIGRVCEYSSVKVTELMVIERYSHVMHIVSNITGRLKRVQDAFDCLRATFPAGTVTGAPKIRAMELIDELENVRRGAYAGCVCYFSFSGNLDSCITIRTIVVKEGRAYVQAGAGIVADSVPGREYRETLNKARALLAAIGLAEKET